MQAKARNTRPVAIAGGGIGGLAAALALARAGFSSMVLEQAREFGEAGVGLQVAPNALSVLDALGVGAAAKEQALLIERMLLMDGASGEKIVDIPCGAQFRKRFGNPYAVAHRADIHGALLAGCRAQPLIELRTQARVTGFDIEASGVSVVLESGERLSAAALVGADGVQSRIRKAIVDDTEPVPSGFIIYRAVIPAEEMPQREQHPYPIMWAAAKTHIIYYPVRGWTVFNFGATVHTGQKDLADGADAAPAEALPLFAHNCARPLRVMRVPKAFKRYTIRYQEPVDNWSRGPVTLLGDAAHAMVQFIAQGAAQALEDAACLGVAAHEADGDFSQAFQRYQAIRIVRSARVQITSLAMDRLLHAGGVERQVRNSIFEGRTAGESYERLAWLYTPPPYVKQCAELGGAVG